MAHQGCHAFCSSGIGHMMTESMPSRLTPRSRNGTTVVRGGPDAGKPKLSPIAKGLIARGLMRLDVSGPLPRLFFTEAGLTALRAMMMDRRLADPKKFAHVRQELGIDPSSEDDMQSD
jgi:2-hydroxychromene-2-carboxylate isomerase